MFKTVKNLDIFFAYGRTWIATNEQELKKIAKHSGTNIRVFLPDPENEGIIKELGNRFKKTPTEVKNLILESSESFKSIFNYHPNF